MCQRRVVGMFFGSLQGRMFQELALFAKMPKGLQTELYEESRGPYLTKCCFMLEFQDGVLAGSLGILHSWHAWGASCRTVFAPAFGIFAPRV